MNIINKTKVEAFKLWSKDATVIRIIKIENGRSFIVKPIKMELQEFKPFDEIEPTMELRHEEAKEFMLAMRSAVNEYFKYEEPSQAELNATKFHLEDMRKLVFNLVERSGKN